MTRVELQKKIEDKHDYFRKAAEDYVSQSWGSFLDLDSIDLVLAGIGVSKVIAYEYEEQIAELKETVKRWKQMYNEERNLFTMVNNQYKELLEKTYAEEKE